MMTRYYLRLLFENSCIFKRLVLKRNSFAATTFVLSMYNVQTRGITHPNVVLGMALGYGGLVQLIAGIEEWACGNTFAVCLDQLPYTLINGLC